MNHKLNYFFGLLFVCCALLFSIYQMQKSSAQESPNSENPQVEAVDPEVQAILEKEAELIRKMNESQVKPDFNSEGLTKDEKSLMPPAAPQLGAPAEGEKSEIQSDGASSQLEKGINSDSNQQNPETPEKIVEQINEKISKPNNFFQLESELGYSPDDYRDPFSLPSSINQSTVPSTTSEEKFDDPDFEEDETEIVSSNPYHSYDINDYKVSGILWGVRRPKAIVKAPSGQLLPVYIGTRLGRLGGVVWAIREKEVVLLMPDKAGDYRKGTPFILRMRN